MFLNKEIKVFYVLNNKPLEPYLLAALMKHLPDTIQNKINRFSRWQDAQACLIGNLLIKKKVLNQQNLTFNDLLTNCYGKPYIQKGFFFNLSHTDGMVLFGVADFEIGLDVELVKPFDFLPVLEDFEDQLVVADIAAADEPLIEFYRHWTQKEACLKQCGLGLSYPIRSFQISKQNTTEIAGRRLSLVKIDVGNSDYVAHLAIPYMIEYAPSVKLYRENILNYTPIP